MIQNRYSWIKNKLIENDLDKQTVYSLYEQFLSETEGPYSQDSYKRTVRRAYEDLVDDGAQLEFDEENFIKLEASRQKLLDVNNSVRKSNRENYRLYNYLEDLYEEYTTLLKKIELPKIKINKVNENKENNKIAILQISDVHANELISPTEAFNNEYNFNIFSKRLKKYITESMHIIDSYNIKKCYLFFTGDLLNSARRLSEQLAMVTSQVKASLLTTYIFSQMIIELLQKYELHLAFAVGNESRLNEYMESSDILSSENWDFMIYQNIRMMFENKYENIFFEKIDNNIQSIVHLSNGFNALILHGHQLKGQDVSKQLGSLLQNYLYRGIKINGIFLGHLHNASIGDFYSRSSSLSGGNAYSNNDLLYISRASQNLYIVNKDLSYNGIKIDLQNYDEESYNIIEELEQYNITNKLGYNNEIIIKNLI